MSHSAVSEAVRTRLLADNSGTGNLVGIVGTNIKQLRGPLRNQGAFVSPYIVISSSSAGRSNATQGSDGAEVTIEVHCIDDATSGVDNLDSMFNRIFGDAMKTAANNRVPTYGLERHPLVLDTNISHGWLGGVLVWAGSDSDALDATTMVETHTFTVQISRVPA